MFYQNFEKLSKVTLKTQKSEIVFKNATYLNVFTGEWLKADIALSDGYIVGIGEYDGEKEICYDGKYIVPGFFDAHLHVESSMAQPCDFFSKASLTGTTSFVIDPHEAANVCGVSGIEYMLEEAKRVDANVFVMLPSCVPATSIDDNGATLKAQDLKPLLAKDNVLGLAEIMDYPAIARFEETMMEKLIAFENNIKDGHSAGLKDEQLSHFVLAGIHSDHEATSYEEALALVRQGVHVHIREGSAAKNLTAIVSGIVKNNLPTTHFSFCSDDKHMEDITMHGHIVESVRKAISLGLNPTEAFKMASIHTAKCYRLDRLGAIAVGYQADVLVLNDIEKVVIEEVYIKGKKQEKKHYPCLLEANSPLKHTVNIHDIKLSEFVLPLTNAKTNVIGIIKHQIMTNHLIEEVPVENGVFKPNQTYAKIAVVERHFATGKVGVGIVKGFHLNHCAIATSVGHDAHNITVIGDNDNDMWVAVKEIEKMQGGFVLVSNQKVISKVDLVIMGLMSDQSEDVLVSQLKQMKNACLEFGIEEDLEVFLILAFTSLTVIPELRITARGVYDVKNSSFLHY